MFGIGSTELLVILVVALVVLGPKSLPGIAKTLGKVMGEFRRVSTEFQRTMNAEVAQDEHEKLKKEAEEELFGNTSNDDASTAKTKSEKPTQDQAAKQDENIEEQVAQKEPTEPESTSSKAEDELEQTCTTKPESTAEQELDIQSPLTKAVADAQAEANSSEPLKETNNKG